jgi:hypothetical protein
MRKRTCGIPILLALAGCATVSVPPPTLSPLWSTAGFANPESVVPSARGDFLYVSNVAGDAEARDGNGFISKVAPDGRILEREWARGLDAPKGLALVGDRLFASDLTALVEIDAKSGALLARHEASGSGFLNDVALAPDGSVLVSDSKTARIYAWRDGGMVVWLEDPLLRSINGLLVEPERLVVATMQGRLLAVDWRTHAITPLAEGLGDADGVAALGGHAYLVSEWPGRLFHVAPDGQVTELMDSRAEHRYLNDFLLVGDQLIVPNLEPGTLSAYRVSH